MVWHVLDALASTYDASRSSEMPRGSHQHPLGWTSFMHSPDRRSPMSDGGAAALRPPQLRPHLHLLEIVNYHAYEDAWA
jgi:hypothetical protein